MIILAFNYGLVALCIAFLTLDIRDAISCYAIFTSLNYVFFSTFITTVPLTVAFMTKYLGWYFLLVVVLSFLGMILSWLGLDNPKLLGMYRKPMIQLIYALMFIASCFNHCFYQNLPLPWNIIATGLGYVIIFAVSYFPMVRVVNDYWCSMDKVRACKSKFAVLRDQLCSDYADISRVGFHDTISVTRTWIFWFGAVLIYHLANFFQYLTILGPDYELWTQFIAAGFVAVYTVAVILLLPSNPKSSVKKVGNNVQQNNVLDV